MYIGYWVVMLFALINSLGKSEEVTNDLQESKAAKVSYMYQRNRLHQIR
jgi:hypothetical protein